MLVDGEVRFDRHALQVLRTVVELVLVLVVDTVALGGEQSSFLPYHILVLEAVLLIPLPTRPIGGGYYESVSVFLHP